MDTHEQREAKQKARNKYSIAVRNGELVRMPCEICGNPKSEGHHSDYSQPLKIVWLCRRHHFDAGIAERKEKREAEALIKKNTPQDEHKPQRLLKLDEAAREIGIDVEALKRLEKQGIVSFVRITPWTTRISISELDRIRGQ